MTAARPKHRIQGLDFARFLAFVGMVIVNFRIVMGADGGDDWLSRAATALEGRAAATFVILAGIGLGLSARRENFDRTVSVTVKRAVFLLVLGLLNRLVFDADILHDYAFFFLFGVLLLPLGVRGLVAAIVMLSVTSVAMFLLLDYDAGWNWNDLTYKDFYTPTGFVRNLFFNGWHPVIPWLAFLLYGIILGRLSLTEKRIQRRMVVGGVLAVVAAEMVSRSLHPTLAAIHPDLPYLVSTAPIPPTPLYLLSAAGAATSIIGLSLLGARRLSRCGVLAIVTPAGRQTLTLYIAHILIGMGTLEALGMLGGKSIEEAVFAAITFCVLAIVCAFIWSRTFRRGPIEMLMRRIAG